MQFLRLGLSTLALFALSLSTLAPAFAQMGTSKRVMAQTTITGRVRPAAALRPGRVAFTLDGASVHPELIRGRFRLEGVPAGPHTLSIVTRDGRRSGHRRVLVPEYGSVDAGTIALQPAGQIAGRVVRVIDVSAGGTEPLAGVQVLAEFQEVIELPPGPKVKPSPVPPALQGITDSDGNYVIPGTRPGAWQVSVVVPGLEASVQYIWVEPGQVAVADFNLRPVVEDGIATVRGWVTDADGLALSGALVTLTTDDVYYADAPTADGTGVMSLPRGSFTTLTDRQGHYTLNVPSGYLWLSVWKEGYWSYGELLTLQPDQTLDLNVTLDLDVPPPTGSIEGIVVDDQTGLPLAGARVDVLIYYILESGDASTLPPDHALSAITDKKGRFRIDYVPVGVWDVRADGRGYRAQVLSAEVFESEATGLNFSLDARRGD